MDIIPASMLLKSPAPPGPGFGPEVDEGTLLVNC